MAAEITDTATLALKAAQKISKPMFQIDPRTSHFMGKWDCVTGIALIFTALVTPFEVAFLEAAESPLEPLFIVNRCMLPTSTSPQAGRVQPASVPTPQGG